MAGWPVMYPGFPKRAGALAETRAAGATAPAAGGEARGTVTVRRNGRKGAGGASGAAAAALSLGALGIVFGDIGTSLWGPKTCATWPDAPLTAGCSAPRRLPGRGMIFGLWG